MIEGEFVIAGGERLFTLTQDYLNTSDRLQVLNAYEFARREHGTQRRKTGELFFTHPLQVATYLAEYRLDADAISAALLHDIAEDTRISIDQIRGEFGPEVAKLVDGVTKLKEVTRGVAQSSRKLSPEDLRQATLQKLLKAMTVDVRTVIIKLFDRLHNMRTIHALPLQKQRAKADETLAVFAPLAYRLGMWNVKNDLESLSLQVINPHAFENIRAELERINRSHEPVFEIVSTQIMECLASHDLHVNEIRMSPESVYTVFRDLEKQDISYREMDRLLRITVLLEDTIECYTALGYIHHLWEVVPNRFDDYISVRRENLYQSLHTTLLHSEGHPLKVRLRTVDMDRIAQIGVLAKWYYAGTPLWSSGLAERVSEFFANISESIDNVSQDASLGIGSAMEDVFSEQIRVYTKDGDPRMLPRGSTPLDFAYRIHTELGNQCHIALVEDKQYPLNKPLIDGDQVIIIKNPRGQPRRAWLDEDLGYIANANTRSVARRWFRKLSEPEAIRQGHEILLRELEMLGLNHLPHTEIAALFGYDGETELYYDIGRADLLPTVLSTRIMAERWSDARCQPMGYSVSAPDGTTYVIINAGNYKVHLCRTCNPRPPNTAVGFLRQDGIVTAHREDCRTLNASRGRPQVDSRLLKLGWGETDMREARIIPLYVDVFDRPGLLHEMTQLMEEKEINIRNICTSREQENSELSIEMELEVIGPRQLVRILHQIEALVNVKSVRCLPDGDLNSTNGDKQVANFYKPE